MEIKQSNSLNPSYSFIVQIDHARLDKFLADQFPAYSRSFFQKMIENNHVSVNGFSIDKASFTLKTADQVIVQFPVDPPPKEITDIPAHIPAVQVIFEHPQFLIINKPAGLIVHTPHAQSDEFTLVDWLLLHYKEIGALAGNNRPGIVHRLDKDTSGIMIIPRTDSAMITFGRLFKDRKITKTYYALVQGTPTTHGRVELPIGRCNVTKTKMATYPNTMHGARDAITHYQVIQQLLDAALVQAKPVTGRTHQIRVHLAAIGHPLIGDKTYGKASSLIARHALHAHSIAFEFDGEAFEFQAPLPDDLMKAITHF